MASDAAHFRVYPHQGEASFTLGCWCNTGVELDTHSADLGRQLVAFWAEHWDCAPVVQVAKLGVHEQRLLDAARRCLAVLPSNRREMVARLCALSDAVRVFDDEPAARLRCGGV